MLSAAQKAEVNQYIAELASETDERGCRLVVPNGRHRPWTVATVAGAIEVTATRVNDRRIDECTGGRKRFSSKILPPWCRRPPKVREVIPLLYLHGLSSGDFVPALEQFLCSAAGSWDPTLAQSAVPRHLDRWAGDLYPGPPGFRGRHSANVTVTGAWSDQRSGWVAARSTTAEVAFSARAGVAIR